MRKRLQICLLVIALAVAVPAMLAPGKIFWSFGSGRPEGNWPGKVVYRAPLQINGGSADLTVLSCPASSEQSRQAATVTSLVLPDKVLRRLTVPAEDQGKVLLFEIEQSKREFDTSAADRTPRRLDMVPAYPGSRSVWFMRNEDTRTALETLDAPGEIDVVRTFYASSLRMEGWLNPLGKHMDVGIYVRGRDVCCVIVKPFAGHGCLVTVLHKTGAMD